MVRSTPRTMAGNKRHALGLGDEPGPVRRTRLRSVDHRPAPAAMRFRTQSTLLP